MWTHNTLIDNCGDKTLAQCLQTCLSSECNEFCIATGYWDLPGMGLLYTELEQFLAKGKRLRMIIGQEPVVRWYQLEQNAAQEIKKFPDDYMKLDISQLKDEFKPVVRLLLQYCTEDENAQIQIRIFGQDKDPKQFMHAKCYIFKGPESKGIIGSANFTKKGLSENTELSYLETVSQMVAAKTSEFSPEKGHIQWFEEKWVESIPWNMTFRKDILEASPIGKKVKKEIEKKKFRVTPYAVYIKYLQNLFGTEIPAQDSKQSYVPNIPDFQKLEYQIDAVDRGWAIMQTHHGFLLADVVGLGKTWVGLMIANRFLNSIDPDGREKDILIIAPPAVCDSWRSTIRKFDADGDGRLSSHITLVTTGKIVKCSDFGDSDENDLGDNGENDTLSLEHKQYGLILVDESHKFRNSSTQMYQALDSVIENCYPQPYVVLMSATPQNNSPRDLQNQIYLFQREPQNTTLDTIEGRKLDTYFSGKQKEFALAKKNKDYEAIKNLSRDIRLKVLDQLLVRRTRTDVRKFYAKDAASLHFPEISGPHALKYQMDKKLSKLFYDTMAAIAPTDPVTGEFVLNDMGLAFERYRAIEYLKSDKDRRRFMINNLTPEGTSKRLAKIMQIMLVKRLESSISAFKHSLRNLRAYTENMINMLENDCVFICPDIDVNAELDTKKKSCTIEQCYDDIRSLIKKKGGNNQEYRSRAFKPEYLKNLRKEYRKIEALVSGWDEVHGDPKLAVFGKKLEPELFDSAKNNPHGFDKPRLVIFTEAIDTLEELRAEIEGRTDHKVLAITADNRGELSDAIKANFDANVEPEKQKDDYDVLITTEVLAEGINLHRANVVLNYDTPWNSTRLMQRIGRVNRIGSREDFVYVYNFMPTAEGDQQIELVNKAHAKLQAFHALFGEDSQIFTTMEEVQSYGEDPAALKKLVEGEESPLEQFAAELRAFKKKEPGFFEWIMKQPVPFGAAKEGTEGFFCVVKQPYGHTGLNIAMCGDETRDISVLEMLKALQCTPDTSGGKSVPKTILEEYRKRAIAKYAGFMERMTIAADGDKRRTAALTATKNIREQFKDKLSKETLALLKIAADFVRKKHKDVIRKVLRLETELNSDDFLPGLQLQNRDVNQVLTEAFGTLQKKLNMKQEPPELSLYMNNEEN